MALLTAGPGGCGSASSSSGPPALLSPAPSHPKAQARSSDGPASGSTSQIPSGGQARPQCRSGVCFRPHVLLQPVRGARACFSIPGDSSAYFGAARQSSALITTLGGPADVEGDHHHRCSPTRACCVERPSPAVPTRKPRRFLKRLGPLRPRPPTWAPPRGLSWPPHCLRALSSARELRAWSLGPS